MWKHQTTGIMKIALYLRVSTDVQDFNRQKSDLTAKALSEGNEIAYTFSDKISGFKDDKGRPELNKLLQLTKDDIQAVYIHEFSRLSRNPIYLEVLIEDFTNKGINIFSLLQNINTISGNEELDFGNKLAISFFAKFSKYEIDLKNKRQKSGKKESITVKGNSYTSKPSYGYTKQDKKLVILEREAEIVRYIFNQYSQGTSIKELVQYLNLNKIPTRNTDFMKKTEFKLNKTTSVSKDSIKWGKSSVRNILRNTAYYGIKKLKSGDIISVPAIVSEELFNKCQDEIKGRITNTDKTRTNNFMLRGIFICGECGKQFVGTRSHSNLLYKCSDKTMVKSNTYVGCRNTSIYKEHIEGIIWETVKGAYSELRSKQIKAGNIDSLNNHILECEGQIEAIDSKLDSLSIESGRILKLYAKGLFTDIQIEKEQKQINLEVETLTRSKRKLQAEINKDKDTLQAISSIENKPYDLSEIDKSYELQKQAIHELVKEVLIFKVDNKYTVFQINFKAGYSYFIIRETWTKKYVILDGSIYSFDKASLSFSFSGMEQAAGFNFEPVVVRETAIELFNLTNLQNMVVETE